MLEPVESSFFVKGFFFFFFSTIQILGPTQPLGPVKQSESSIMEFKLKQIKARPRSIESPNLN